MALGVYKPGQGYWTRVLTAVGLGALALSGALWLYDQMGAFPVPQSTWALRVTTQDGAPAQGQALTLFADAAGTQPIGTATIESVDTARREVSIGSIQTTGDATPLSIQRVEAAEGAFRAGVSERRGRPDFSVTYLQAGAAAIVIVLAAVFVYWVVALRPKANEFLISVDNEMRKVNWSTRREIIGSTWVVIAVSFSIAATLFVVDNLFSTFFRWVGVLDA
ncbi:MAG: preprotein translocase subunit SecE [Phycisphaerales bacterium]